MHTLDHNILIDIKHKNQWGIDLYRKIEIHPELFGVVNIGASELRLGGIRPDRYNLFESFLLEIGLEKLVRFNPLALIDITFIEHSNICSEDDADLYERIKNALFPSGFESNINLIDQPPYQPIERKRLNQICDAVSLWCHVKYSTESFVSRDDNFQRKSSVLRKEFGAKIIHPSYLA